MTDWIVRRWARYGHERLYAETSNGTALGYFDVKAGRYHTDDLSNLSLLQDAIAEHLAERPTAPPRQPAPPIINEQQAAPPAPPSPAQQVPTPPPPPIWHDISANRAGAAARERAMAEREAQGTFKHLLSRLVGARTEERSWRIGADGEEAVAAQLLALGPAWRVLHAVRVGERGADIDHVVIGPPGVFTVNAKHHPHGSIWVGGDTFMVNGQRVPYIRNSRHEARRASRMLTEQAGFPVIATGLIAVMGAQKGFKIRTQPEDGSVVVVMRRRISHHLLSQPFRLSKREIDAIYDVARRSTTWQ
ncbi:nuclease-related domain-containing protein [Nocardioides sp. L-11A]|uniref:nuclease-related domain-containing protein n=1 Tax=Nocardioides sp. L-11A TaxID=3043848 RepID=UPI00249C4AC9|nr:nuclease-related domain-containing protein [Nocardioides sp. L-11A]